MKDLNDVLLRLFFVVVKVVCVLWCVCVCVCDGVCVCVCGLVVDNDSGRELSCCAQRA